MMASLEEENEVLLARYCTASFLPPLLDSAPVSFRPRWLTAAEESSAHTASVLHALDGPVAEEDHQVVCKDASLAEDCDDQLQSPLLALPEELLWLVWELSRPTPDDLCRWSLVCRRFDRVACGHVGLWTPFLPAKADLSTLLALTTHCADTAASSSLYHRINPKVCARNPECEQATSV
jgi:hypothetical protein